LMSLMQDKVWLKFRAVYNDQFNLNKVSN
jgi:hypothetical protein